MTRYPMGGQRPVKILFENLSPERRARIEAALYNASMDLHTMIVRDPSICGGQPSFRGTRVTLRSVLASLADGDSVEQIVQSFPTINDSHVRAAIAFAAASVQEDLPVPELPTV